MWNINYALLLNLSIIAVTVAAIAVASLAIAAAAIALAAELQVMPSPQLQQQRAT